MSADEDYRLALELHRQLNEDLDAVDLVDLVDNDDDQKKVVTVWKEAPQKFNNSNKFPITTPLKRSNPHSNLDPEFLNRTQNLVHPQWETLDPTPDVFALFGQFDEKFFQNRLKCVTLEWSKRMYSCAGICYSRRNHFGMAITIRLSEPLLKLRPRKDLVETMLHEMIHAYCFVLKIREGNGGHGPYFKKIMQAINKVAGTNITVYHTFHDEVDLYKQHWWRCNGVCQDRSPFFGFVKRTSNRAPGPNDIWWSKHQQDCGGTFMKIKEPEKPKKSQTKVNKKSTNSNKAGAAGGAGTLHKYFTGNQTVNGLQDLSKKNPGGPMKMNGGGGTMLLNPRSSSSSIAKAFPPSSYPGQSSDPFNVNATSTTVGGNLRNVRTFNEMNQGRPINANTPSMTWGQGKSLDSISENRKEESSTSGNQGEVNRQHLRDLWSKRFAKTEKEKKSDNPEEKIKDKNDKKRRLSAESVDKKEGEKSPSDPSKWIVVDDDLMLHECEDEVIAVSSDDDSDDGGQEPIITKASINKKMSMDERQAVIKKEILNDSLQLCDEDIELIDDEYDDKMAGDSLDLVVANELANTSVIDEFFGNDTLLKDYLMENEIGMPIDYRRHLSSADHDIITCPICQCKMQRKVFAEHLNGCTGIAVQIKPPTHALKKLAAISKEAKPQKRLKRSRKDAKEILREAGYSESDLVELANLSSLDDSESSFVVLDDHPASTSSIISLNSSSGEDETLKRNRQRNLYKTTRQCPACAQEIEETEMNRHILECRSSSSRDHNN